MSMNKSNPARSQLPAAVSVPVTPQVQVAHACHGHTVYQLQRELTLAHDVQAIAQLLLDAVQAIDVVDAAALLLLDGSNRFHVAAGLALPVALTGHELAPALDAALREALEKNRPSQITSDTTHRGADLLFPECGTQLCLPLQTSVGVSGMLVLARRSDQPFQEHLLQILELCAAMAAQSLANQSLLAALQAAQIHHGSLARLNASLRSDHQRSQDLASSLANLAAASGQIDDEQELLTFVLESLRRFVDYDSASIWLQRNEYHGVLVAGIGFDGDIRGSVLYVGPGTIGYRVANSQQACLIDDVQQETGWQHVAESDVVRSWIGVPLISNKQFFGMMTVDKRCPAFFCSRDAEIAQAFADHVALALHHQQVQHRAAIRAVQLQLLHRTSVRLATIHEVPLLFHELAREMHETFGYYQVMIALIQHDRIVPYVDYGNIVMATGPSLYSNLVVTRGLMGWAVRNAQTLLCNDVSLDQRYFPRSSDSPIRSELVVPIKSTSGVLGLIDIESTNTGAFDEDDIYLVEALAGQAAVAMEHIARYNDLRTAQERLLRSSRMQALGELSSGVAHDFNNLLTGIIGHTQLLLHQEHDEVASREGLQIIERIAFAGAETVRRLRDFAQTNQIQPQQFINIHDMIEESLSITRPRWRDDLQSKGLRIDVIREYARLPLVQADPPALRDLLTNLILNAIDAMPGGGTLRISTALVEEDSHPAGQMAAPRMVSLSVGDTGVGIPHELQEQVFDPFFTTKGQRGTGMGLAMAHSIVQRHGGDITVMSSPGQGSTFTVRLPLPEQSPLTDLQSADGRQASGRALNILVVDDEAMIRAVLLEMLRRNGHQVVVATGGNEALVLVRQQSFDLVCSDLGMPDLSGWDVLREIRAHNPRIKTMLITGWGDQISAAEAHANGVDYVVTKPFDYYTLSALVNAIAAELQHTACDHQDP